MRGKILQPNEKQKRGDCMEQNIRQVMATRFEIENLAIDHVRDERERMPVACLDIDERPGQTVKRYPLLHQCVSVNVRLVVVVHEIVAERLAEDDPDERDDAGANGDNSDFIAHF